ncbi:HEAT repeat domain-containing protein [Caenimonas aquaedulcis]|uniref:HEAT repeat domain-containing protein n=1 Tax=Caenimonas aquaedulcis TaxID=2793270 RepID=A0A931MFB7_9BURK|nr:HEAT repeat domain-containing protein [Caenimonas aquaedulcis]
MSRSLSDPYLLAAFWAGVVSVVLTLGVAVAIVSLRVRLRREERRWNRFLEVWRPILMSAMVDRTPRALARLRPGQARMFLRLWAYLHESVRGESARRLDEAARAVGADRVARKLLRWGSRDEKLLAILCVGHLRDTQARDDLLKLAAHPDGQLSVNAARSLVQIDPLEGAQRLMHLILGRGDWDVARVAGFLTEAREAFWLLLVKRIVELKSEELVRALRFTDALRLTLPAPTLRFALAQGQPPEVVAAALATAADRDVVEDVRRLALHPDARVRAGAAHALGRMGGPQDVDLLAQLLGDAQWPVRLAAAQTIANFPYVDTRKLEELQNASAGSHDILRHVLAELAAA